MAVPNREKMFNPLLKAMHDLGGSASVGELEEKVANQLKLNEEELNEMHDERRTKFSYRLAWARTYLKNYGLLENSSRGVWSLTPKGQHIKQVKPEKVTQALRNKFNEKQEIVEEPEQPVNDWIAKLLGEIAQLSPGAFERLCQRVLRESGFIEVNITGRSGDQGIDGTGILKLGGFLSFHIIFQCKRYSGSVGAGEIRDFRGATVGRTDKGLFMTTGTFTAGAKQEATRDGAPPIDLIDGQQLAEKMRGLALGVSKEETYRVDLKWLRDFNTTND